MRTAYKVLAYLVAAEVAVEAMVMCWAAWLAVPGYVLLLATRVSTRPPSPTRATALTSGARS